MTEDLGFCPTEAAWRNVVLVVACVFFFFCLFVFLIFRERGREGENRERNIDQLPLGDQTHHPDMYPDLESNWWPFTLWGQCPTVSHSNQGKDRLFLKLRYRLTFWGIALWCLERDSMNLHMHMHRFWLFRVGKVGQGERKYTQRITIVFVFLIY